MKYSSHPNGHDKDLEIIAEIAQGYDLADYFLMRNSEIIDTP